MFGMKRFIKDLEAVCKIEKSNTELGTQKLYEAIERYAKNNFVTGWLTATAGAAIGIVGANYVKRRKEKKCKELKEADK